MPRLPYLFRTTTHLALDAFILLRSNLRSRTVLAAENLFLPKQLALYRERHVKPRRANPATRVALVLLARVIDWKPVLTVVRPDTLIRWHRAGWRLYWRWRSRPRGRPPIPRNLRQLIVSMARANPTWGEERIANELLLKLGIAVSPRTVGRYRELMHPPRRAHPSQVWSTFVRNHAQAVLACDFCVAITASFQLLYV